MLDLLRDLEWAGFGMCLSCLRPRQAGHAPDCRLARAIRELAEESPGEPLDIPATAAFIRDHVAIADRVLGPVVDGPAICPPPRTTRPILPPEPTVDEMAREMGLVLVTDGVRAHWADRETGAARIYWSAEKARATHFEDTREWLNESDAIRTLYREHKAKQQPHAGSNLLWTAPEPLGDVFIVPEAVGATSINDNTKQGLPVHPSLFSCGRPDCHDETYHKHEYHRWSRDAASFPTEGEAIRLRWRAGTIAPEKPPADPSALAAWLYARVGHGTWAEWVVRGNPRPSKEAVTGCDMDDGAVWLDLATSGRARIPGEPSDRLHVVRLLNPDGTVLWEAK